MLKLKKSAVEKATNLGGYFVRNKKDEEDDDIAPIISLGDDIGPVREDASGFDFFDAGTFADGYDFGDITKTILGVSDDTASLKDLTVNSLKRGYYNSRYGEESFRAMNGMDNEKETYRKILEDNDYQFTPGNRAGEAVSGAMELLGQQFRQFTNPRTLSIAAGAAGAAAVAGQAGPQVLIPEEIVTVPTAAFAGFTAGSAASNLEIEAGHAYNEMVDAGISEETAKKVAWGVGGVNAALELVQVDELLKAYKITAKSGATKNFAQKLLDELVGRGVDVAKETAQEVAQEGVTIAGVQAASKIDNDKYAYTADEVKKRLADTAKSSALSFGLMNAPAAAKNTASIISEEKKANSYADIEQTVIDKEVESRIAEQEKDGRKLTNKEKAAIEEQVARDLDKGYIAVDTIEEALAGDLVKKYKHDSEWEASLRKEYDELYSMRNSDKSNKQIDREAELKKMLAGFETKGSKQLKEQIAAKVYERAKGTRLAESYSEKERRTQAFAADVTKYSEKQRAVVQKAVDSGVLNNTNRAHELVDFVARISADKGIDFDFTNNAKLKESGFAVEGKVVNGYKLDGGVVVNVQSRKALNSVVGHEITHVLEGTELYGELQTAVMEYAKTRSDYKERVEAVKKLYEGVEGADAAAELTADLVGDYLFTDEKFVASLSANHKNLFQKIFDEIKYLLKTVTAGSKEARELEKVKRAFEKAYRDSGSVKSGKQHSFSSIANSFFGHENMSAAAFEEQDYMQTDGYREFEQLMLNNYRQSQGNAYNEGNAKAKIRHAVDGIVRVAVAAKKAGYDIADNQAQREAKDSKNRLLFSSLEPNSDYFTSHDISAICDKRQNFGEIYDEIVRREEAKDVPHGKRFFDNVDNYFAIHKIMADKGLTTPCRQCYVESMRKNLAPMANAFLRLVNEADPDNMANDQLYHQSGRDKGKLKTGNASTRELVLSVLEEYGMSAADLSVETLTTEDGLAQLKLQAPLVYEAFNSFYGQSKPKMPKAATPYRFGELTALLTDHKGGINQRLVKKINDTGGFRLQSYSDFQIRNYPDVLQVLFEASTLGLNGHAYTKVPAFLDATANTNLKRNISIFMYKDGDEWKLDRNDSFPYTLEEIYDLVDGDKSGNTGIIAVSQNEDMSAWIMANDKVGYGIPYHKSGQKMSAVRDTVVREGGREIRGYSGIKDHTKQQSEVWAKTADDHKALTKVKKGISIYDFWDFENKDGLSKNELIEKNVTAYIEACEAAGYLPKFRAYVMNNGKVLDKVLEYSKKLGTVSEDATISDIAFECKGYMIPYGYYKFLGDFGMFTPDGKASPHEALSLENYDFDKAVKLFEDTEALHRTEILQQFANGDERERYRSSNLTAEELERIVQRKRSEVAAEVVNGTAKFSLSEDADAEIGPVAYAPTFYSHMAKTIDGVKQQKLGAASVIPMLRGKGVKQEEIKWSGIEEFLAGKKSVTKAELQEFAAGAMLEIEEVELGETKRYTEAQQKRLDEIEKEQEYAMNEMWDTWVEEFNVEFPVEHFIANFVERRFRKQVNKLNEQTGSDITKGQERILHLAALVDRNREEVEAIAMQGEGQIAKWMQYKLDGGSNYRELLFKMPDREYSNQAMAMHWDDRGGVLAHARVQDFENSFTGWRTLFVEEIQSDWHNEGHKVGYASESQYDSVLERSSELFFQIEDLSEELTGLAGEWEAVAATPDGAALIREYDRTVDQLNTLAEYDISLVPDAPFRDNYTDFVMKRLLRMAAEEGYDSIGWTTGALQMNRWNPDRKTNAEFGMTGNPDSIAFEEGYRIEYDQDIPKFLRKYGKKWGAVVEKSKLEDGTEIWSMDITDSMRESVLYEGQPMYSLSEDTAQPVYGSWNIRGEDAALHLMREDIGPVQAKVADHSTVTEDFSDIGPVRTETAQPSERGARRQLHSSIIDGMKTALRGRGFDLDTMLKKAKNLSTFATVDNTPQRVMEKTFGYAGGQALADLTVNRVAQNETVGIRWLNRYTDRKNGVLAQISKRYGIKPGSKQSAAAQMYAEGFYVNENGDCVEYGDRELAMDFPDPAVQARIKGLASDPQIRRIYDETLDMINQSRTRNAYPEIQRLDNYFLHFRAMNDTFSTLGLPFNPNDIRAKDLPTDLNGMTADLKPGQPFFASAMHRTGRRTSFDLLGGLEQYLNGAKNQIFHIDDIQTHRALRNYIADMFGQANGLNGLDDLSEEEQQERIEQVYNAQLSTFAKFLNEEANILAGKTALIDRGLEGVIGRRAMTFMDTLNRQVGANMVGYNISSSLTNFLSLAQGFAKSNKAAFVKGLAQFAANKVNSIRGEGDGFAEQSPVMVRRKGVEKFHRTAWQMAADPGYALMSMVDEISTELIARAKYIELTDNGMDEQQAHMETDKWVSRLLGDRSLGQQPQLFNSKTLGMVTKFQLEVRNQLDAMFYDTYQEAKLSNAEIEDRLVRNAKTAAKVTSTVVQMAVAQHLFGAAFEAVAGYNPAFDIISVIATAIGWDDDEEEPVLDNIEQAFFELMEDLPYVSTLTGGRIPIADALPIKELYSGQDAYGNEKSRMETLAEAAPYYFLPGGYSQIKKTAGGVSMYSDEHPIAGSYTDSGKLRFPVDDSLVDVAQAAVFGQWANGNARDYFDGEHSSLNEKQLQEFMAVDMTIQEYWGYREGLSGLKTNNEKGDYIGGLDIPVWQKNILINNLIDRDTPIDMTDYGKYKNFEEFDFAARYPDKYAVLKDIGMSVSEYKTDHESQAMIYTDDYSWAASNPEGYAVSRAVTDDVTAYKQYTADLAALKADKNANGKSISGSRKKKVIAYINGLDIDDGAKMILYKSEYPSDDSYNYAIVEYLNSRSDLTYEDIETILLELDFKVGADGSISW